MVYFSMLKEILSQNKGFRFYTYFTFIQLCLLSEILVEVYVYHNSSFLNSILMFLFIPLCLIVVSVWIKFFFKLLKQAKLNGSLKNEIRTFYKIELLMIVILVITFIPPLFSNDGYKNAQKPFGVWDPSVYLNKAKGLLLPTTETLPQNFVGDARGYGFGSNEGCFGPMIILKDLEGAIYCFRFFDSKTATNFDGTQGNKDKYSFHNAEIITFRANSYPDGAPISKVNFDFDLFIDNKLNKAKIDYIRRDFEYAGIPGTILSYNAKFGGSGETILSEEYASTTIVTERNVKRLFWNDTAGLNIEWSTPAPKSRSFEEILGLLHSMRRTDGTRLSNTPESSTPPQLLGDPVEVHNSSKNN